MSYANKKERIFRYGDPLDIPHSRSEARMKKYWSATDRRAWCDEVELRRQHILELNARSKGQFCLENFIPLDLVFNAMASNKDAEIEKLQRRIQYLEALLDIYKQIQLTPEQQKQVDALKHQLDKEKKKLKKAKGRPEERGRPRETGKKKPEDKPSEVPRRASSEEPVKSPAEKRKRPSSEPRAAVLKPLTEKVPTKERKRAREPSEIDKGKRPSEVEPSKKPRTQEGEKDRRPSVEERKEKPPVSADKEKPQPKEERASKPAAAEKLKPEAKEPTKTPSIKEEKVVTRPKTPITQSKEAVDATKREPVSSKAEISGPAAIRGRGRGKGRPSEAEGRKPGPRDERDRPLEKDEIPKDKVKTEPIVRGRGRGGPKPAEDEKGISKEEKKPTAVKAESMAAKEKPAQPEKAAEKSVEKEKPPSLPKEAVDRGEPKVMKKPPETLPVKDKEKPKAAVFPERPTDKGKTQPAATESQAGLKEKRKLDEPSPRAKKDAPEPSPAKPPTPTQKAERPAQEKKEDDDTKVKPAEQVKVEKSPSKALKMSEGEAPEKKRKLDESLEKPTEKKKAPIEQPRAASETKPKTLEAPAKEQTRLEGKEPAEPAKVRGRGRGRATEEVERPGVAEDKPVKSRELKEEPAPDKKLRPEKPPTDEGKEAVAEKRPTTPVKEDKKKPSEEDKSKKEMKPEGLADKGKDKRPTTPVKEDKKKPLEEDKSKKEMKPEGLADKGKDKIPTTPVKEDKKKPSEEDKSKKETKTEGLADKEKDKRPTTPVKEDKKKPLEGSMKEVQPVGVADKGKEKRPKGRGRADKEKLEDSRPGSTETGSGPAKEVDDKPKKGVGKPEHVVSKEEAPRREEREKRSAEKSPRVEPPTTEKQKAVKAPSEKKSQEVVPEKKPKEKEVPAKQDLKTVRDEGAKPIREPAKEPVDKKEPATKATQKVEKIPSEKLSKPVAAKEPVIAELKKEEVKPSDVGKVGEAEAPKKEEGRKPPIEKPIAAKKEVTKPEYIPSKTKPDKVIGKEKDIAVDPDKERIPKPLVEVAKKEEAAKLVEEKPKAEKKITVSKPEAEVKEVMPKDVKAPVAKVEPLKGDEDEECGPVCDELDELEKVKKEKDKLGKEPMKQAAAAVDKKSPPSGREKVKSEDKKIKLPKEDAGTIIKPKEGLTPEEQKLKEKVKLPEDKAGVPLQPKEKLKPAGKQAGEKDEVGVLKESKSEEKKGKEKDKLPKDEMVVLPKTKKELESEEKKAREKEKLPKGETVIPVKTKDELRPEEKIAKEKEKVPKDEVGVLLKPKAELRTEDKKPKVEEKIPKDASKFFLKPKEELKPDDTTTKEKAEIPKDEAKAVLKPKEELKPEEKKTKEIEQLTKHDVMAPLKSKEELTPEDKKLKEKLSKDEAAIPLRPWQELKPKEKLTKDEVAVSIKSKEELKPEEKPKEKEKVPKDEVVVLMKPKEELKPKVTERVDEAKPSKIALRPSEELKPADRPKEAAADELLMAEKEKEAEKKLDKPTEEIPLIPGKIVDEGKPAEKVPPRAYKEKPPIEETAKLSEAELLKKPSKEVESKDFLPGKSPSELAKARDEEGKEKEPEKRLPDEKVPPKLKPSTAEEKDETKLTPSEKALVEKLERPGVTDVRKPSKAEAVEPIIQELQIKAEELGKPPEEVAEIKLEPGEKEPVKKEDIEAPLKEEKVLKDEPAEQLEEPPKLDEKLKGPEKLDEIVKAKPEEVAVGYSDEAEAKVPSKEFAEDLKLEEALLKPVPSEMVKPEEADLLKKRPSPLRPSEEPEGTWSDTEKDKDQEKAMKAIPVLGELPGIKESEEFQTAEEELKPEELPKDVKLVGEAPEALPVEAVDKKLERVPKFIPVGPEDVPKEEEEVPTLRAKLEKKKPMEPWKCKARCSRGVGPDTPTDISPLMEDLSLKELPSKWPLLIPTTEGPEAIDEEGLPPTWSLDGAPAEVPGVIMGEDIRPLTAAPESRAAAISKTVIQPTERTFGRPLAECKAKCNLPKGVQKVRDEVVLSNILMDEIPDDRLNKAAQMPDIREKETETHADLSPRVMESISTDTQDEFYVSAQSKHEGTETRRPDHKCMAPCRNAKGRPTIFGEETGGVVLGTDTDTPHDLVPPGYYLPDDSSPKPMPDWASSPGVSGSQPEILSLMESDTETDNAIMWIAPKTEEQIFQAPKDRWVPKLVLEWEERPSTEKLILPENIRTGNVMARVLSGQAVGLPPASPIFQEGTSPQTLTQAIYQRKARYANKRIDDDAVDEETAEDISDLNTDSEIDEVCRAPCANKKVDQNAVDEEPVETIADISDLHTDSEVGDEVFLADDMSSESPVQESEKVAEGVTTKTTEEESGAAIAAEKTQAATTEVVDMTDTKGTEEIGNIEVLQVDSVEEGNLSEQSAIPEEAAAPTEIQDTENKKLLDEIGTTPEISGIPKHEAKEKHHLSVTISDVHMVQIYDEVSIDQGSGKEEDVEVFEEALPEKASPKEALQEEALPDEALPLQPAVSETVTLDTISVLSEEGRLHVIKGSASMDTYVSRPYGSDEEPTAEVGMVMSTQSVAYKDQQTESITKTVATGQAPQIPMKHSATEPQPVVTRYVEAIERMPVLQTRESTPRFTNWFSPRPAAAAAVTDEHEVEVSHGTKQRIRISECLATCRKSSSGPHAPPCRHKCALLQQEYHEISHHETTSFQASYDEEHGLEELRKGEDTEQNQRDVHFEDSQRMESRGWNQAEEEETAHRPICKPTCRKNSKSTRPCRHQCGRLPESNESESDRYESASSLVETHICPTSTEPEYQEDQKHSSTIVDVTPEIEKCLKRLSQPMKVCRATCATGRMTKDERIKDLEEQLEAKDAYCEEQRKIASAALAQLENIKSMVEERDDLRKKLENSQYELAELKKNLDMGFGDISEIDNKKSEVYVPFKESDTSVTNSCDEEIRALENEIEQMRATSSSPEKETTIIKKEVEVLKKYCSKLSSIQEENSFLKKQNQELQLRCMVSEEKLEILGCDGDQSAVAELKEKLLVLNETVAERDILHTRVRTLERELNKYHDLPEDIEVFKRRSMLLDDVLKDRDRLAKRVEQTRGLDEEMLQLKQKSERVDELERQLRLATKDVQMAEDELDSMRNKCAMAEIEALNQKTETETLKSKIVCMEHEIESLKFMCKEQEILQMEKERLQVSLDELLRMQDDYEHMCVQMKALDVANAERDRYKRKYEELLDVDSECNALRAQLDQAKMVEHQKDSLEKQAEDLEKCICEQEEEIKRLVCHIDCLAQGKEQQQVKMKEVVSNLKLELEEKESQLVLSEEKIATINEKIDTSLHSLTDETMTLRQENENLLKANEDLIKEKDQLQERCQELERSNCDLKWELQNSNQRIVELESHLDDKNRAIEIMQEVLSDRENFQTNYQIETCNEAEITRLQTELDAAKSENLHLQHLACQAGSSIEANYQIKTMLEQSKCAIERIALELEQQYSEWDNKKKHYKCCPGCNCKGKGKEPKVIIKCCAGCTCKTKRQMHSQGMQWNNEPTSSAPERETSSGKEAATSPRPLDSVCQCKPNLKPAAVGSAELGLKLPPDLDEDMDEDAMFTARSAEDSKVKIAELEAELVKANDTIIGLKEQLAGNERTMAENTALRKHSSEVQEIAKDQIKDLVERLKIAQHRIGEVEAEKCKIKFQLAQARRGSVPKGIVEDLGFVGGVPDDFTGNLDISPQGALLGSEPPDANLFAQLKADLANCMKDREKLMAEISKLRDTLTGSGDEAIAQLKRDLETCLKEKESLLKIINDLQNRDGTSPGDLPDILAFRKMKADLDDCLKEKELLLKTISDLQKRDEVDTGDFPDIVEFRKMKTDLENCLKERELLLKTINDLQKRNGVDTGVFPDIVEFRKMKADLANCLEEKEMLMQKIKVLSQGVSPAAAAAGNLALQQELEKCKEALNKLKAELQNCLNEKEKLTHELQKVQLAAGGSATLATDDTASLKSQLADCLKERQELLTTIEDLKNRLRGIPGLAVPDQSDNLRLIEDLKRQLAVAKSGGITAGDDSLRKDLEDSLRERDNLRKMLAEIKQPIPADDSLKNELENALRERDNLQKMLGELKRHLSESKPDEVANIETFAKLKVDLENCLKEKEALLKAIDNLKKQLASGKTDDSAGLEKWFKEKQDLLNRIADLQLKNDKLSKEKEDLDKMLMSNVVTTSRRSSKLETDLDAMSNQNKKMLGDIDKLSQANKDLDVRNKDLQSQIAASKGENDKLKAELERCKAEIAKLKVENDSLKKSALDPSAFDALKKENENYKKQLEGLMGKIKQLPVETSLDKDAQDRDTMQSTINDLENQIKALMTKEKAKAPEPSGDYKDKINELMKQLNEAQKRAEASEDALRKMKASDPTAMLNTEMDRLKARIGQLEKENQDLKNSLAEAANEIEKLKKNVDNASKEAAKFKDQNDALQKAANDLKAEKDALNKELQKVSGDKAGALSPGEENIKLKAKNAQLEDSVTNLKSDLDKARADAKQANEKFNQLLTENGDLKKKLAVADGENSKLQKDLEAARADGKRVADKVLELEKDNAKCKQTVKDLEAELARVKKELDSLLNDAKKGTNVVSDLQNEIAALKQRVNQLESLNMKLSDENGKVKKELEQARGGSQVIAALQDENNNLRQQNSSLQGEIDKLKKELENALADGKAKLATATQLQDSTADLKKRIQQLEAENADLKKTLAASTADKKLDDLQKEYDKLRQRLAETENQNSKLKNDLQKALDDAKKSNDELNALKQSESKLKGRIAQLEGDNEKLKKDLNKTLDDMKKMGMEVSGIQGDESKSKQKAALLDSENSKLNKDLENALDNARKTGNEASLLKDENSKLKQRLAQLEAENAKLKSDMDGALVSLRKATDESKELQDENNKCKQKIKQLEDEIARLKQRVDAATKDVKPPEVIGANIKLLEDELSKVKKDLEGARKEIKDVGQENSKLRDDNDRLQQKLKQLEADNAKLKADLDAALKAKKDADAQINQFKSSEDKLKNQLAQMDDANKKLQKEKSALADDISKATSDLARLSELKDNENKLKQRIAQLEAENAKLKKDLDSALNDRKKMSDDLNSALSDINKLKQQLAQTESDNKKLKSDLEVAKKQAVGASDLKEVDDKLRQRIAQLEADNAELKSELDKALDKARKTLNDIAKLQDEDKNLKQKLAQLEMDNSKMKKVTERAASEAGSVPTADIQNENSKLKQQVSQLESDNSNLKKQLDAALNDAKSKVGDISKLQDEIKNLKQRLAQLDKENGGLKKDLDAALKDAKAQADNSKKFQDETNKVKQKITQLESEIDKLKKELEAAKAVQPTVAKPQAEEDKKRSQQLDSENAKLKKDLENAQRDNRQIASLKDENSNLKNQNAKLQSNLDKAKRDLDSAVSEAKKSAAELAKVKESEAQLKLKVAQLETDLVKLKKDLDEARAASAEAAMLKAENKKLKDQIKQLQDELNRLKSAKATPESTKFTPTDVGADDLKDEISKLKQKLANLQTENTKLKEEFDDSKSALHQAESTSTDTKKQTDKLNATIDELRNQLKAAKAANQNLQEENDKLKKKVAQLELEVENLKKQLAAANEGLSKAKQDMDKLRSDSKADKDALNSALQRLKEGGRDDYENRIRMLEEELENQKKECQDTIASLKAQFDRDIKNLVKKNDENIDKLQKAHGDYVNDLNNKHGKEVKDLRDALERLRKELEGNIREKDKLKNLFDDQKRKSLDIKEKVEEVEKVISKERRRSKELEKKHSDLKSVASVLEQEVMKERKKSLQLEKDKEEVGEKLRESLTQVKELEAKAAALEKEKEKTLEDGLKLKKESVILKQQVEEAKRKSETLESEVKAIEVKLMDRMRPSVEEALQTEKVKEPKVRDDKLTMATFETVSLPPVYLTLSSPFSAEEMAFYGKKLCPCVNNLDDLLKKAAAKGFGSLTVEELQFVHKHLNEAAANALESLGQKAGVLRPSEGRDRLSLLRRIAELEGDLLRKQRQTQEKIGQMQNAIRLEKDRLSELRRNLEREKEGGGGGGGPMAQSDVPRRRISRDADALEKVKSQLEKRLNEELLNRSRLTKRLAQPVRPRDESPVRDTNVYRRNMSQAPHSTGKL